jgi:hypothetical protein
MHYFAYGADMQSDALAEALAHPVHGRRARLPGFRLAFTPHSDDWDGGVADILPEEGAEVEGVVFELSPADELRLGFAEGLGEGTHRRRRVRVELEDGEEVEATARDVARKDPHVAPSAQYLDAMVSGATEQGLSEGYINFLMQLYPDIATPHARPWAEDE